MTYHKARRSGRITIAVPILLIGSDSEGRVFSEETKTVIISLHGAGILSRHKLVSEQELVLRSLESNREADIRVVGEIGSQGDFHAYGVAFVHETLDFWKTSIPPPEAPQESVSSLSLECASCTSPLVLEHGDFEFDVCVIHGGLVRYCDHCGFATVWKFASQTPAPSPQLVAAAQEPEPVATAVAVLDPPPVPTADPDPPQPVPLSVETLADFITPPDTNRRLHRRAKVNYYACVRTETFGDDIVPCIDMSRGGLSFKTKNPYPLSSLVNIAVPFARESPTAPAIFVPAQIANIAPIAGSELFRCGVAFMPLH
ncbi:MAG TPA: PilZ domain-containing protein [Candidatus Acidoferrum sp.]